MMLEPKNYKICVDEVLEDKWNTYFTPLELSIGKNETILFGKIHDQAELFGILLKIRDLGLHLSSVNTVEDEKKNGIQGMMSCIMIM